MRVISFDPGGTTGWCTFGDYKGSGPLQFLRSGQLTGQHHSKLRDVLREKILLDHNATGPYYVIYERFDNRDSTDFANLISCEYIGVIKEFCQEHELVMVPQGSSIKTFCDAGGAIRKTKWYIEYSMPHAWDAARHLYYWLVNGAHPYDEVRMELLRMTKPPELTSGG